MDFPTCLTKPNASCTFASLELAQSWNDLALWETFLDAHRVESVMELGTWRGGMATFLAFQCKVRGITFKTIDHAPHELLQPDLLAELGAETFAIDIHSSEGIGRVLAILAEMPSPKVLFCDDGDKRAEVKRFASSLNTGDFLVVHDWLSEIGPGDIPEEFEPILQSECETVSSITRFFRR